MIRTQEVLPHYAQFVQDVLPSVQMLCHQLSWPEIQLQDMTCLTVKIFYLEIVNLPKCWLCNIINEPVHLLFCQKVPSMKFKSWRKTVLLLLSLTIICMCSDFIINIITWSPRELVMSRSEEDLNFKIYYGNVEHATMKQELWQKKIEEMGQYKSFLAVNWKLQNSGV